MRAPFSLHKYFIIITITGLSRYVFASATQVVTAEKKITPPIALSTCIKTIDHTKITYIIYRESYVFKKGENLSELLYKRSLAGRRGFELYSRDRWLQKVMALNPKVTSWSNITPGTEIILEYPKRLGEGDANPFDAKVAQDTCIKNSIAEEQIDHQSQKEEEKKSAETEAVVSAQKTAEIKAHQDVVDNAQDRKIEEITALPKESIQQIPKEVLAEKLTEEKLAELSPEAMEKIPQEVVVEKAEDSSFFDSIKPGMGKLFEALPDDTASGYIGLRYGNSFAKAADDPLASKVKEVGVLAEFRRGPLSGTRLYVNNALKSKAQVGANELSLQWQKISLGYAFEFKAPFLVDLIHLTPKLGRYTLDANLLVETEVPGEFVSHHYSVGKGIATGLEVDAEFASLFYVLRGWAAKDFSGVGLKAAERVTSTRYGLDLFLKSSGINLGGRKVSIAYLAFISSESVQLQGEDDLGPYDITLYIPFAGLGLGIQW